MSGCASCLALEKGACGSISQEKGHAVAGLGRRMLMSTEHSAFLFYLHDDP